MVAKIQLKHSRKKKTLLKFEGNGSLVTSDHNYFLSGMQREKIARDFAGLTKSLTQSHLENA